jgi:hypothetical protein
LGWSYDAKQRARYEELIQKQLAKNAYTPEEQEAELKGYQAAMNASPRMHAIAGQYKDIFSQVLHTAMDIFEAAFEGQLLRKKLVTHRPHHADL